MYVQAIRKAETNLLVGTNETRNSYYPTKQQSVLSGIIFTLRPNLILSVVQNAFALLWTRIVCLTIDFLKLNFYSDRAALFVIYATCVIFL